MANVTMNMPNVTLTTVAYRPNEDLIKEATHFLEFKAGVWLQRYFLPAVIIMGLIGNTLSFIVCLQAHNRCVSFCVYMACLALTDTGALLLYGFFWVHSDVIYQPFEKQSCQIQLWFFPFLTVTSVYTVILMTLDRCLAVRYPLRASRWCTSRKAFFSCIGLITIVAIYAIPYSLYSGATKNGLCASLIIKTKFSIGYSWLALVVNSVIPFVVLLSMNIIIVSTVRQSKQFANKHIKSSTQRPVCVSSVSACPDAPNHKKDGELRKSGDRERQLLVMLLLVSFAVLILTLPLYIRTVIYMFFNPLSSPRAFAIYNLCYHVTNKMYFVNSAINFFMYIIGGSRFRSDVLSLLQCRKMHSSRASDTGSRHVDNVSAVSTEFSTATM